jgi:uncharacterized glyoxalase superfamily protein PhnB
MQKPFKPAEYNSVSPYFIVNGAQKFADLLKVIFNAVEKRRFDKPDGSVMHMEMQIDDSIIMMGDASEQWPANTLIMHVYVPDVEETFNKAIQAGCESIEAPKSREGDPDIRGTFKDFAGNMWSIGTQQ